MDEEKKPITRQELNALLERFLMEQQLHVTKPEYLRDQARHFLNLGELQYRPYITPVAILDPDSPELPRVYSSDGIPDIEGLKVMQQNSRSLGELLLTDDAVALDGGAIASTAFQTRGWAHLLITIVNPTWATNPTALTVTTELSTDAFDTETFILLGLDGVEIIQTLQFADAIMQAYYVPVTSNAGALAATNTPQSIAVPDIDGMTARLFFTPVGAAITNEAMTINVYGVTPR